MPEFSAEHFPIAISFSNGNSPNRRIFMLRQVRGLVSEKATTYPESQLGPGTLSTISDPRRCMFHLCSSPNCSKGNVDRGTVIYCTVSHLALTFPEPRREDHISSLSLCCAALTSLCCEHFCL